MLQNWQIEKSEILSTVKKPRKMSFFNKRDLVRKNKQITIETTTVDNQSRYFFTKLIVPSIIKQGYFLAF
jgi:hypothetical protein